MGLDHNFAGSAPCSPEVRTPCAAAERERQLGVAAPRAHVTHYPRPAERPFAAVDRDRVTILLRFHLEA